MWSTKFGILVNKITITLYVHSYYVGVEGGGREERGEKGGREGRGRGERGERGGREGRMK